MGLADAANTIFLLNAFSLQMIDATQSVCFFEEVSNLPQGLTSAIGHADTATVLGVEMNRINVHLNPGDIAYIAQLQGGRLPEGSITLPEGFSFKYYKVTVVEIKQLLDLFSTFGVAFDGEYTTKGIERINNSVFPDAVKQHLESILSCFR